MSARDCLVDVCLCFVLRDLETTMPLLAKLVRGAPAAPLTSQMAPDLKTRNIPFDKNFTRDEKLCAFNIINNNTPSDSTSTDKTDNGELSFCDNAGPDMRREDERLKTFAEWPVSFLRPQELAKSGFYYLGRGDEVRCAFCKVEIMRWEEGDDPAVDHERWAPQCPLLRRRPTGNVPLAGEADGRDECGVRAPPSPPQAPPVSGAGTVRAPGPANPRYACEAARLRSFSDWPRSLRQKPEDLAEAGFFYTGQGDKTKCFYCDGGLKDWEDDDVPWEQHALWFERCAFVQLVKGREYVQKLKSEHNAVLIPKIEVKTQEEAEVKENVETVAKSVPSPAPAVDTEEKETAGGADDSKMCKICFADERNVCFVPCGHVVACAKCALATHKCPMCRMTFQSAIRLYYS